MNHLSDSQGDVLALSGVEGIPGHGPHMIIILHVRSKDNIIASARFSSYKCPAAQACGQWVTEAVEGKPLADVKALTEQDVIAGAGGMPLGREHCPKLAIDALYNALAEAKFLISASAEAENI